MANASMSLIERAARMAKVYVIQDVQLYDKERNAYKSKFNLTTATQYGELVYLMPAGEINNPQDIIPILQRKLANYGIQDYLLLIGSPDLIGWATAIAANVTDGFVNTLSWERGERCYRVRRAQLW